MTYGDWIGLAANWSAILTALLASIFSFRYWLDRQTKRQALEKYLEKEKEVAHSSGSGDKAQRSLLHLMRHLGLTESDILQAAFSSKKIGRRTSKDETGRADALFLVYEDTAARPRK